MASHDPGVAELLRRASDNLTPDVNRLVRGGITRGRTRQRRARISTTVASLAVVGIVGGLANVVPALAPDPPSGEAGVATGGMAATSPSATPDAPPERRVLAVEARRIPALVTGLFSGEVTDAPETTGRFMNDGPRSQIAHFLWNGTLMTVSATRGRVSAASECASPGAGVVCTERPDGSTLLTWEQTGPQEDGGVTGRGVSLFGADGWLVSAIAYNAAEGKGAPLLAPEPPLTYDDLERIVTSSEWFR